MTMHTVSCESFNERLMSYLEHEVDDAARAALERHAMSCDDCGGLLADLRKLRVDSANLPVLTPSRDLWSGIAARIEAPVVPIGPGTQAGLAGAQRRLGRRAWWRAAGLAASLLVAAGVGYFAAGGPRTDGPAPAPLARGAEPVTPSAVETPASSGALAEVPARTGPAAVQTPSAARAAGAQTVASNAPAGTGTPQVPGAGADAQGVGTQGVGTQVASARLAVATLTADYDREVVRLRGLIDQRRNQLDPVTVAIIEKNLQVIDAAIAECQRAVERDPSSRYLIESLNQSLQTKLELMRTAAVLPPRT